MRHELFFLLKDKAALLWVSIAFISALMAVFLGLNEVGQQRSALDELKKLDRVERAVTLEDPVSYTHLTLPTICSV